MWTICCNSCRSRRATGFWVVLIVVLAAGLRWFHLNERVVWYDESTTVLVAKTAVPEILMAHKDGPHPPLYPLLLHGWLRWWPGEIGARGFSVAAGTLTVLVVFGIGCRLGGREAGLLSALVLAACPLHIWYSQELRMYALQVLLVSLAMLSLVRLLERGGWGWGLLAGLTGAFSLYAQYTSWLVVIAQTLYVVGVRRHDRPVLLSWLVAVVTMAVLFAPWLLVFAQHFSSTITHFWIPPFDWGQPPNFLALLSGSILHDPRPRWPSIAMTTVLLVSGLTVLCRQPTVRAKAALPALWFLFPIGMLALLSLRSSLFVPRGLVIVAPAFAVIVGWGAAAALAGRQRVLGGLAVLGLLLFNAHALAGYYAPDNPWIKSPLRDVSRQVAAEFRPGDLVVHSSRFSYRPFQYYVGDRVTQTILHETEPSPWQFRVIGDSRAPVDTAGVRRIWLVLIPDFEQPGLHLRALDWMRQHHRLLRVVHESSDLAVELYDRRDATVMPPAAVRAPR